MGKLIRNGIEYGGGNGTDIFKVTQAEYDALKQAGTLVYDALYVIDNAPNLNATAKQISYDGGTDTVWDNVEAIKPTFDIGGAAKGVSGTYQIPAEVMAHSIINISLRRYAYAGTTTIITANIAAGAYTNGLLVYGAENKFAEFSISTAGLITITKITNWDSLYIDLVGTF